MNSSDDFIGDAKNWATMAVPGSDTSDDEFRAFDRMPIEELAAAWCTQSYVGLKDTTEETHRAFLYFEHLPHQHPERAFALVLAVLRSEADKSVKMHLNNKMMTSLLYQHGDKLVDEIENAARDNAQLRWLLGGAAWWTGDARAKARLEAIADEDAWRADTDARDAPDEVIDYPSLNAEELARAWIEQKSMPYKNQDDNWQELMDYERELLANDPDRMIDMILAVLRIEDNPHVLGLLAAGPFEDVIGYATIDRIEREAAANDKFAWLVGGVWYHNEPDDLKARLDAIVKDQHWAN